jgi:hypothetical protein
MIAVRNVACRSITASPRQGRCCVCARVVSDPRTDLLFGEEIGEAEQLGLRRPAVVRLWRRSDAQHPMTA